MMKNNDLLYNVLVYRFHDNTFALVEHNLSAREAQEQVNELHEQRLPAFRGRQTGEHAGPVEDCTRCQRAATMMIGIQRADYTRNIEQEQDLLDLSGPEYLYRLRLALMALPVRQIRVVACRRCGEMMEREGRMRETRPHRSDDGDLCPSCIITRFLLSSPDLTVCLRATIAQQGRHILLNRDFQKVLGAFLLAAEDSDFALDNVDWRKVRDGWDLA